MKLLHVTAVAEDVSIQVGVDGYRDAKRPREGWVHISEGERPFSWHLDDELVLSQLFLGIPLP